MLAFHLIVIGIFVLLGILFSLGKGAGLIAGFNTSSAAEKAKFDKIKLCKFMGKLMYALAVCWMVIAASDVFQKMSLRWVGYSLFMIVLIAAVVYMNTGNRFKL